MPISVPTSKEDMKDILKRGKEIIVASPVGIMFLFGAALILVPFVHYDEIESWRFPVCPSGLIWLIPFFGLVLLVIATIICCKLATSKPFFKWLDIKKNPVILKFGNFIVNIKVGKIEELSGCDKAVAVVLGVNTIFIDDCISDAHSAFGAFNSTHCLSKIEQLRDFIKKQLELNHYEPDSDGAYPIGTTLNLTSFYDKIPVNVFLTASTIKKKSVGFKANPASICECIRQVFEQTADQRISKLRMPILGSGRGGLPINTALLLQLVSIKHYFMVFPHIKTVDIIVLEKDANEIPDYIKNLQYVILPF